MGVVGALVSGEELFRIEQPTDGRLEVLRADIAKALRTNDYDLMLYERERALSDSDIIQDAGIIIVKHILPSGWLTNSISLQGKAWQDTKEASETIVNERAIAPVPEAMCPGGVPTAAVTVNDASDKVLPRDPEAMQAKAAPTLLRSTSPHAEKSVAAAIATE